MSANSASVTNQGEFHSSIKPSKPMEKGGHAPGVKVGNDAAPEFSAETLPAGTAPADRTFKPNPVETIPGQSYPNSKKETWQSAESTLTGATSADVTATMGRPIYGQTTGDLRHDTSQRSGLEGVGTSESDPIKERGLDRDHVTGGKVRNDAPLEERRDMKGAEERASQSAGDTIRQ